MAIPTVFVSSTFYDLRYVREGVKRFVDSLGYGAVLSEEGTVFFDPRSHTAESCIREVGNVEIFVLIIGGRYGSSMPTSELSVTNAEYQQAISKGVPVFALVEQGTYNDFALYSANSSRPELIQQLTFPNTDAVEVFMFIETVRSRAVNNALVPFRTVGDIENYLKLQWAGMMHNFLTREAREENVSDTLEALTQMNERVEVIAEQILKVVGAPIDTLVVRILNEMIDQSVVSDLRFTGARPTPGAICQYATVVELAEGVGAGLAVDPSMDGNSLGGDGRVSEERMTEMVRKYEILRSEVLAMVEASGMTVEQVVAYEAESVAFADSAPGN